MKKFILVLLITGSIAACSNNSNSKGGSSPDIADSTPTITSGNNSATMSQAIPRDSVERSSDSTGNINPADTTKKPK